jgi:RNA polymerase sigma factor (sigma-70 family)
LARRATAPGPLPEQLFEQNLAWAERIARSVKRGLPPSFDVEDLEQAARIELWRQTEKYDPSKNDSFQGFAHLAIHGAVLMQCRRRKYREATHEPLDGRPYIHHHPRPDQLLFLMEEQQARAARENVQLNRILEALKLLPTVQACLVYRIYLEGTELSLLPVDAKREASAAVRELRRAVNGSGKGRKSTPHRCLQFEGTPCRIPQPIAVSA